MITETFGSLAYLLFIFERGEIILTAVLLSSDFFKTVLLCDRYPVLLSLIQVFK